MVIGTLVRWIWDKFLFENISQYFIYQRTQNWRCVQIWWTRDWNASRYFTGADGCKFMCRKLGHIKYVSELYYTLLARVFKGYISLLCRFELNVMKGEIQNVHWIFKASIIMKNTVFRNVTPSSPIQVHWGFGGPHCFHLQRWRYVKQAMSKNRVAG
jgi:hypothetical protein